MTTVDNKVTGSWWLRLNYTVTEYPDRIVISANGGPYSNSMNVQSSLKMSATCKLMLDDQSTTGTITFYTITSGTYKSAVSGSKTIYKGHEEYWVEAEVTCTEASDAGGNATGLYHLAGYSSSVYLGVLPKDNWAVSFNANGGSNSPNSQTKWYNENLTLSTSKPSRTGYSFIKWNTKADGTGTDYNPGASYTSNAALTLYAIWYPTVTYNANGGSGAPAQAVKTTGTPITISPTQPTRAGYTFSKWNTSADGSETDYSPGASYSTDAPLVLYAQWTPNTYQVSFDANTGKHAPSAINRTYGQPVTLPSAIPVKMAADFVGWATNSSGTGTLYQPGGSYTSTVAAAEILYAVWRSTYTDPVFAIDVVRTDDQGVEEDDGDHALITVLWSINPLIEPDTGESTNTATLECYMSYIDSQGHTITTEVELEDVGGTNETQGTKTSGTARALVSNIDTDTRYTIEVTIVDSRGTSVTKTEILSMAFFTMDFLAGGHGVGIGKPAKREMLDVGMQTQFDMPIRVAETDVPPTFYYATKPAAANLPVRPCVVIQTSDWSVWYCDNAASPSYHQLAAVASHTHNFVEPVGRYGGSSHAVALKSYFDANKSTTPREKLINMLSTANNNGAQAMGYFIRGYDSNPYGGFFVAHYNTPYYVGISDGVYTQWELSKNGHTHSYLPLSGGTLTGNILMNGTNLHIRGKQTAYSWSTTPSSSQWIDVVTGEDSAGNVQWNLRSVGHSDGYQGVQLEAHRVVNGSNYYNGIRMEIDGSGARRVILSDATIWRNAIDAAASSHSHSYATTSDFPRITSGNEIRFDVNTMPPNPIEMCIGWAWSGGTKAAKIKNYKFFDGNAVWAPVYASNIINSEGGDRLNQLLHAGSYMHVETANHGNFGVSWWSSDIRMKSNIEDSDVDALELVNAIEHRSFDMNDEHYQIGYIAQELEKLDPQLVVKVPQSREVNNVTYFTGDYRYQIDPNKVIPYLSRSIQQLSSENAEFKRKNEELEGRLEAIERKLGL